MLPQITDHPTQEEIATRAREIYEQEGRQDGLALEHWMRAERELREQFSPTDASNGQIGVPPDSASQIS